MKHFRTLFSLLFLIFPLTLWAVIAASSLPDSGVLAPDSNNIIDPNVDYEHFSGRVTDKDDKARVFKVHVENNNTKFFRSGDLVLFKVNTKDNRQYCKGFVRSVEDFYFTIYVETLHTCFKEDDYFRRGTVLNFYSKQLAERILEGSLFRGQLVTRKQNFLRQMNDINHFLWTFDQQKVKTGADYDAQINELQRQKQKALDDLITEKQEKLVLQNELQRKLNDLDESLKFYRVERQELMTDRWENDHDLGHPVGQRPQVLKQE